MPIKIPGVDISFSPHYPLSDITNARTQLHLLKLREELKYKGVYILSLGLRRLGRTVENGERRFTISEGVFYIGAADAQTLFGRLKNHRRELTECDYGKPGKGIRNFREKHKFKIMGMHFRYAVTDARASKYAEGTMIDWFKDQHEGRLPEANTQG